MRNDHSARAPTKSDTIGIAKSDRLRGLAIVVSHHALLVAARHATGAAKQQHAALATSRRRNWNDPSGRAGGHSAGSLHIAEGEAISSAELDPKYRQSDEPGRARLPLRLRCPMLSLRRKHCDRGPQSGVPGEMRVGSAPSVPALLGCLLSCGMVDDSPWPSLRTAWRIAWAIVRRAERRGRPTRRLRTPRQADFARRNERAECLRTPRAPCVLAVAVSAGAGWLEISS